MIDGHITLDKAPRLSISIVIWILSSDTICQLNQFHTNSEAAMLSTLPGCHIRRQPQERSCRLACVQEASEKLHIVITFVCLISEMQHNKTFRKMFK